MENRGGEAERTQDRSPAEKRRRSQKTWPFGMSREEATWESGKQDETFAQGTRRGDGGGGGNGKPVSVDVRTDTQSREFLTWALVKAAATGHHVHRQYAAVPPKDPRQMSASLFLLSKELVAMFAVDESFCNLKQIVLKLKI